MISKKNINESNIKRFTNSCVCVYTLPPVGFFRLHDVCDIRDKFGSTIFFCEY